MALVAAAIAISVGIALLDNEPSTTVEVEIESSFSYAEQEAAREAFKQALSNFESGIGADLTGLSQGQWQTQQVDALHQEKQRALALFAKAGFMQALGIINTVQADAEALIMQWHQAYELKLDEAEHLYANEQIQQSRLALSQADKIKAKHPQSEILRAQLSAYDRVQSYLSALAVARVENNIENQVALMQQVLAADPTRKDMKVPLQAALTELKQKRLALALGNAQQALEKGNIAEANTYIQLAETIQPTAKGIAALRSQLNKRLATQGLSAIKAELTRAQATDDWAQVLTLVERGLGRFSTDAQLQQIRAQAEQVLSTQRSVARFLAQPERLADSNIRLAAKNTIERSILLLPVSNSLAKSVQSLAAFIDKYSAQVEVTVLSDGMTNISVIGIGVVGLVDKKVIALTPGQYIFEGRRPGFRSKRVNVEVSHDTANTILLICDEAISG